MSFPQLGYPQFLSASHEAYGSDRPASAREGGAEGGVSSSSSTATAATAAAAAVGSVLGMYGSPWAAHNYSAFLPYSGATDLALLSQMVRADCSLTLARRQHRPKWSKLSINGGMEASESSHLFLTPIIALTVQSCQFGCCFSIMFFNPKIKLVYFLSWKSVLTICMHNC